MVTATPCRSCGTELRSNAKFCHRCGSSIASATRPAEYKQVTVLFADVVHSMDIAAAVGAERLREIMIELINRCGGVVQRYGGTLDKFTGDGIMAVFGAPAALEKHAIHGCMAALEVQNEAQRMAAEVNGRDHLQLQLRVGLNSGQVIVGEIGSKPVAYTAVGEHVGMAQRMESAAQPGWVMLSESTARLVEGTAVLGEPECVRIKGAEDPVLARRLLAIASLHAPHDREESTLVGRDWQLSALAGILRQSIDGHGDVVAVKGPAGIGKSRLVRELAATATSRGVDVLWTYCEAHTSQVPFYVVAGLLRAAVGVAGPDNAAAREQVRTRIPDANPEDLLLLHDLLGIGDPDEALPRIDPDARRRRLTALINAAALARTTPRLYVIEDLHWIDEVSELMLADFLAVIPQTLSMVVLTYRPEYHGALADTRDAQTITVAPLRFSQSAALITELLGSDPSAANLARMIADRADGNPFFIEEIVRDLAERGVLMGRRGNYVCHTEVADISVPASLQATIAARIDRLDPEAKRTLNAAAVIGSAFDTDLLSHLGVNTTYDQLLDAALIDQIKFIPRARCTFRHPLIRKVAYESQLRSDRARLHRRLATVIEAGDPQSADENAALIAQHLEAAGDLHAAYGWHMRAATWATNRDISAARLSWERARKIADALPAEDPNRAAMRIAPRTMLCGIAWRVQVDVAGARFDELRELCTRAGDKVSLAIGMAGLVMDHAYHARVREASQLASEAMTLIESVGDPTLTVGLSLPLVYSKCESADWCEVLRWSQRVIYLADGDPAKGNFIIGSPLAVAITTRAIAGYYLGRPGWRDGMQRGLTMARSIDPMSYATVVSYIYVPGIQNGVVTPNERVMDEIADALRIAERSGDDLALPLARMALGLALVQRQTAAERDRGQRLLAQVSEVLLRQGQHLSELPIVNVYLARERARCGDPDSAIPLMRAAVDHLVRLGQLLGWGIQATGVLVETLLDRGADGDVAEAEAAVERLAAAPTGERLFVRDVLLLRLQALLARARGDEATYRGARDRYRDMARTLGFEGHIAWAEALP